MMCVCLSFTDPHCTRCNSCCCPLGYINSVVDHQTVFPLADFENCVTWFVHVDAFIRTFLAVWRAGIMNGKHHAVMHAYHMYVDPLFGRLLSPALLCSTEHTKTNGENCHGRVFRELSKGAKSEKV